ncbi:MAG TPA: arylamine N-acetyltransferase [Burkholderiaceae bacterium]|nr:arylamine N-acetyltransferase [Burkholderiaceae bacterium]
MFDLDAYFARIGLTPTSREPSLALLEAICAAHPAAIPFENLDAFTGRAPQLAPAALQAKLVGQRRGGYCFEQNALLRLALLELGFDVTALAARVVWGSAPDAPRRPRTHMLLLVALPAQPAERFLVDAGFGGHLIDAPLRFEPGRVQRTPSGTERIVHDGAEYALEAALPAGWAATYRFTLEPQTPVDYEPLNWYTATRPGGLFVHNLKLERLTRGLRAGLLNDQLTLRPSGAPVQSRRVESAADLAQVLEQVFGIEPPVSAAALFDRVPKGLDGPHLPTA